jgi:sugar/nucleoside kinase (ribokinase family)
MASSGARLLIDAQGLVRRAETGPLRKDGGIGSALRHVAILKLNEGEAAALAGGTDAASLRRLEVPEVILTLGSRGSLVVTADADEFVGATPVETADPTGAGDAFAAAYLWFRAEELRPKAAAAAASDFVTTLLAERT